MTVSRSFRARGLARAFPALLAVALAGGAAAAPATSAPAATYADLADLADAADLVVHVRVARQAQVPAERAPGLAPGHARLYIEAQTKALIAGAAPLGESVSYLADVPLDAKGKVPKLKKREFLLFSRAVPGKPDQLQLVGTHAQLPHTPAAEARLRPILSALAGADAPPAITGVRDALAVPGTLAGESETQVFLSTATGDPAALTIVRRPGMAPSWGVSFSEIVDQSARPPVRETLAWYRLACFLPATLPARANLSSDSASRAQAADDYALVMRELGPCPRAFAAQ
ncbi:hypothetical protein [Tsuneonella aeria]|uniref:hypothetical protein n=1 Tax=Tsuneonella aeria TaxID=1837929 RepID=UPI001926213C|nr:hypothetical protein [Tsuneonella aeria]